VKNTGDEDRRRAARFPAAAASHSPGALAGGLGCDLPAGLSPAVSNRRRGRAFCYANAVIERDEEGCYVASAPQIPACHTQARSLDEVTRRIREAHSRSGVSRSAPELWAAGREEHS
jgi:hypothetical protein